MVFFIISYLKYFVNSEYVDDKNNYIGVDDAADQNTLLLTVNIIT